MEDGKEKREVKVVGGAKFVDGKLIVPNLKDKKTAEQLLKEHPLKGQLKREIDAIEASIKKPKQKVGNKEVNLENMLTLLTKQSDNVTTHFNGYDNVVQCKGKTICWISDRKKWISVSTWETGGKNWKTVRVATQKEMYDQINILKERIENVKHSNN